MLPLSFWEMPEKIYHLSLEWKPVAAVGDLPGLEVRVDGVLLSDLVCDWENAHESDNSKKIAQAHGPIIRYHSSYLHSWLGEKLSEEDVAPPSKASLLGCSCGEVGCWPLQVSVMLNEKTVVWSDFLQPFRPEATIFEGFGPFTFHRAGYEAEVRRAMADAPA